jgi:signal transduction histidine kinase
MTAATTRNATWLEREKMPAPEFNAEPEHRPSVSDLENRYQALQAQLRHAQRMEVLGRLVGGVVHDFNNLLSVLLGYSELLIGDLPPNHSMYEPLLEIRKNTERAAVLTRRLLMFSRVQSPVWQSIELSKVVGDLDKMLRRLITENITLTVAIPSDLDLIRADLSQIEQVIMNLVLNARDAMTHGGKLVVEADNVELPASFECRGGCVRPGRYVMLSVTDTGCGMDTETQAHIFEPFFTTKPPGSGTGLGLATVEEIVKEHGGYIWLNSQLGVGTTFRIFFPSHRPEQRPPARRSDPKLGITSWGNETILLVEDDKTIRSLLRQNLQTNGYRVIEAGDGLEALRQSRQEKNRIDLMVADVVLPRMNGQQLAAQLLQDRPNLKVLFLSGYSEETVIANGAIGQGMGFLAKPFTPTALATKIRDLLDE